LPREKPVVTFQVVEGVDKGRIFRELALPVTIGREDGNVLRLNDERVSRFHAKVQIDKGDIILTDLESTNGTRVNGVSVQIRRLKAGDRVGIGRSILVFGSNEEIAARLAEIQSRARSAQRGGAAVPDQGTAQMMLSDIEEEPEFNVDPKGEVTINEIGDLFAGAQALPPLPQKLSPAQAARLAEILDFLHRGLSSATENLQANDDATQVTLSFADWQKIQAVHMLLARYLRAISEPEPFDK
jgi:pSer/pThr/pTyr-binding forkhead associated (FHA) protein